MIDAYLKKTLDFDFAEHRLRFHVAQDLFSSHQVDVGTARLLRMLQSVAPGPYARILDLGCGYGPLGLTLKALHPESRVDLVDRDALALLFSEANAKLNRFADIEVYGTLGYDDVRDAGYDLVISNIPGKAGESAIASMLLDARHFVVPEGAVAIVVVAPLAEGVAQILKTAQIEPLFQETRSGHALFFYRTGPEPLPESYRSGLERGIYARGELVVERKELSFTLNTAKGLAEFDSVSYATDLLVDGVMDLDGPANRVVVLNPGQGIAPVLLAKRFAPQRLELVDRDLLALRYSSRNLALNGCTPASLTLSHQVGLAARDNSSPSDLIVGILREEEGQPAMAQVITQAADRSAPGGNLVVVASSTAITRLTGEIERDKRFRILKRRREKGQSLLRMVRR